MIFWTNDTYTFCFIFAIVNVFGITKIKIFFLDTQLVMGLFTYYLFPILILTLFLKVKKFSWLKRSLPQYAFKYFKYSLTTVTSVFFQLNCQSLIFGKNVVWNYSTLIELLNPLFGTLWYKSYVIVFYSKQMCYFIAPIKLSQA